jgi:subtilisin family serine protease
MGLAATSLAAVLLFAAAGAANAAHPERSAAGPWVKGRVLVMPNPGLSSAQLDGIAAAEGGKARRLGSNNLHVIELPAHVPETAALARFKSNPHFKFAELDQFVSSDLTPNDPFFGSQWHLPKIGGPDAWSTSQGTGVIIAILDSGVQPDHPDLKDRLVPGYNFVEGNTNTTDVRSHGTKVAGSAASALNNGTGVASVSGQSRIMPIRVSDSTGYATWSAIAQGLTYAADKGAKVANVSFNGAAGSSSVLSAAKYMKDKGGLVFVSAGNSNTDPNYANTNNVIIVAATTSSDTKASFSNFGDHVHLSAPGAGVYTTTWSSGYASVSGTSFSAPITAGVAALVMAANPSLTPAQVEKILFSTAKDLGTAGYDIYFGHGRVDAAAAVTAAVSTTGTAPTSDTTAPTVSISSPAPSSTVSGTATVGISANDNIGVSKVELWVNGSLHATDSTSPFGFSWDTTKVASGSATLAAKAFDAAGNAATSSTVTVNVANTTITTTTDTTAPTTSFTNPANGATVPAGNIKVEARAGDNAGVGGLTMTLSINGSQVASSTGTGTISYGWNTRRLKSGGYTLMVTARDAAGNTSSSSVTVYR